MPVIVAELEKKMNSHAMSTVNFFLFAMSDGQINTHHYICYSPGAKTHVYQPKSHSVVSLLFPTFNAL